MPGQSREYPPAAPKGEVLGGRSSEVQALAPEPPGERVSHTPQVVECVIAKSVIPFPV